jgi:tRNA(Arg) A34 adenosine deaminase TadA
MYKGNTFYSILKLMDYAINQLKTVDSNEMPVYSLLLNNLNIIDESNNIGKKHSEQILLNRNHISENLSILVTLEPCPACLFNMYQNGIRNIFFGGYNYQYGTCGGKINLLTILDIHSKINIYGGFYKEINEKLILDYFQKLRNN